MALFTDKRELSRQGERVGMEKATGLRKVGLAALGYKDDGSLNTWGQIQEYNPNITHGLRNTAARAIAKDGTEYNEVIKGGSGDAWTQDLNSLDFAWQAFKIYLTLGGDVGASAAASGAATGASGATTTATTGTAVTSGASAVPAGAGTAVQGVSASTGASMQAASGASDIANMAGTGLTGVTAASAGMTTPVYETASWTQGPAMDAQGNIVDKQILDSLGQDPYSQPEQTMVDRFLDYLNTEYDGVDGRGEKGITAGGEEFNVISPDVMGRKGAGTGASGNKSNLNKNKQRGSFQDDLTPEQKAFVKDNITDLSKLKSNADDKNVERDYMNWKETAEANGLRVVGMDAVDNAGRIVAQFENPSDTDENKGRANNALKNMALGNIVTSGMNMYNTGTSNIADSQDRAAAYQNQQSITTNYLA